MADIHGRPFEIRVKAEAGVRMRKWRIVMGLLGNVFGSMPDLASRLGDPSGYALMIRQTAQFKSRSVRLWTSDAPLAAPAQSLQNGAAIS